MAAIVVAGQAFSRSNDAKQAVALNSGVQVSLTEFALTPSDVEVADDASITVTNEGTAEHNLAVKGTDVRTENLSAGDRARLDLVARRRHVHDLLRPSVPAVWLATRSASRAAAIGLEVRKPFHAA